MAVHQSLQLTNDAQSAFETIFSLLEGSYARINHADIFDCVQQGLGDEHEIKMLCLLMLTKLMHLDSDELQRRLDGIADQLRQILSFRPKENAVKQEIEKAAEVSKAAIKSSLRLQQGIPAIAGLGGNTPAVQKWRLYWTWVQKEHRGLLATVETELRTQT